MPQEKPRGRAIAPAWGAIVQLRLARVNAEEEGRAVLVVRLIAQNPMERRLVRGVVGVVDQILVWRKKPRGIDAHIVVCQEGNAARFINNIRSSRRAAPAV